MEPAFLQLGLAVLLGLLVGLQREYAASGVAGLRTFPLITMLGTVSALLAGQYGGWMIAAGLLGIAVVIATHSPIVRLNNGSHGATTDVAMLLMFGVGALLVVGPTSVAVAIGGAVAVLLQFKPEMHGFVARLGDRDLRAIMQFVLITCIILPVLPQRTLEIFPEKYASLNVLNPFEIWLMVVLVVGMSLAGYIVYKFAGKDAGVLFGGILGGAISSTATTVSYSRLARNDPWATRTVAIVVMIASTVSLLRVLIAVAVVSQPEFLLSVAGPMSILMLLTLLPALILWVRHRHRPGEMPQQENPTQLKSAIIFGLMYALVLFALAAAKFQFGSRGLYWVAGLSGLTEMDAITLSTARLSLTESWVAANGWRLIVLAVMSNMISKAALAGILGGWRLLIEMILLFSIPVAGGTAVLGLFQ